MLLIRNEDYFHGVKERAEKAGLLPKLQESLDYLAGYACHNGDSTQTVAVLHKDFAPESFSVAVYRRIWPKEKLDEEAVRANWLAFRDAYELWFQGGLIFYNPNDNGSGSPQFSVSLDTSGKARWELHT